MLSVCETEEEETGGKRKVRTEEPQNLHSSQNINMINLRETR